MKEDVRVQRKKLARRRPRGTLQQEHSPKSFSKEIVMDSLPFVLSSYIEACCKIAANANAAEHKPTSQKEIDDIGENCKVAYEKGSTFVATIDEQDILRCRRLYEYKRGNAYYSNDLFSVRTRIQGEQMLIPNWATLLTEVRALQRVLE